MRRSISASIPIKISAEEFFEGKPFKVSEHFYMLVKGHDESYYIVKYQRVNRFGENELCSYHASIAMKTKTKKSIIIYGCGIVDALTYVKLLFGPKK